MIKKIFFLLCIPLIGYGQVENNKSLFNFNKTNDYNSAHKKVISKKYYNSTSTFNFQNFVKANSDSTSKYTFYSQNKASYSPFNQGLIQLLSRAIQKAKQENGSIFNTQNKLNTKEDKE